MATEKRDRQRANRALKVQQEQQLMAQQNRRKRVLRLMMFAVLAVLIVGFIYVLNDMRGSTEEGTKNNTEDSTEEGTEEGTENNTETNTGGDSGDDSASAATDQELNPDNQTAAVTAPAAGGSIEGPTPCPAADGSAERITQFEQEPPQCISDDKTYSATFSTTKGEFKAELDAKSAPTAVNNFVVLARYHFYDGVPFHRIVPGFVIQGGDAVGPTLGIGNPGYLIDEEQPDQLATGAHYEIGSLAMAKGLGEKSTGSQFFIVTGPDGESLDPEYSRFGKVTEGIETVKAIEAIPTTPDSYPTEEIYIQSVIITES